MKSKYCITVKKGFLPFLIKELKLWGVKESQYQIEEDKIITSDNNVIDVATETFIKYPEFLIIEKI